MVQNAITFQSFRILEILASLHVSSKTVNCIRVPYGKRTELFHHKKSPHPQLPSRRNALLSFGVLPFICAKNGDSEVKNQYIRQVYDRDANHYDDLDGGPLASLIGFEAAREAVLAQATEIVLEIGIGTGLNIPHYRFKLAAGSNAIVNRLVGIDISTNMLEQARLRCHEILGSGGPLVGDERVRFSRMDAASLSFPDASFDTVVDTFGLCVFDDPEAVLLEMRRVCKPGGQILLLENASSTLAPLAAYQRATGPLVARAGGRGCDYGRDPVELARRAGLRFLSPPQAVGVLGLARAIRAAP